MTRIRPEYAPPDPSDRLVHLPGEQVQRDLWFPGQLVPDHAGVLRSFPVLVMVAAHSRFIAAVMIPSRVTGDLLAGMWQLISENIGGVPRTLLWDNESGIGQRHRLAQGVAGFCGVLGTRLIQARPYDPETKGVVERANGYLETSFLPGRTFASAADFNAQLQDWLFSYANRRTHAGTRMVPVDALVADQAAMATLPPVAPVTGTTVTTRLGRDYYVSLGGVSAVRSTEGCSRSPRPTWREPPSTSGGREDSESPRGRAHSLSAQGDPFPHTGFTAVAAPNGRLTISQQAFAIHNALPDATVSLGRGTRLTITADLQPTQVSRNYSIKIDYRLGASPDVQVVTPKLELHRDAEELPHTFPGERLCLHLPGEWTPNMYIAHTTVSWTSEWLFYYEIWLITGEWEGGGHGEPNRRRHSPDHLSTR